jgi:hypothetical protein
MSLNPDALNASPRFKMYTLDGATDVDIQGDLEQACRRIVLLSTASGDLTLRQSSQVTDGTKDQAITVTNLPAGYPLDVQATRIVGGLPSGLKLLVLCCFALLVAGCTKTQANGVVSVGNDVCQVVLYASDPALAPLCVTAEEIADAIIALTNLPAATPGGRPKPTQDQLRAKVLEMRAAKAGAK